MHPAIRFFLFVASALLGSYGLWRAVEGDWLGYLIIALNVLIVVIDLYATKRRTKENKEN